VRFYIYFDSDYELDADSVEEKNKVGINLVFNSERSYLAAPQ